MTGNVDPPGDAAQLRRRAEALAREKAGSSPEDLEALSPEETRRMLHELGVHQIELEMQNEELRRAQVELDAARARYFDLYDLAPVGYCTLSEQGLILEANFTAATLLGVVRGVLVKQLLSWFILDEAQDTYYLHRRRLFETGQPQAFELRMVKTDGTAFWAWMEATVVRDADGAPVCRVVLSDITERKQAEEALRESKEQLQALIQAAPMAIIQVDREERVKLWNPAAEHIFGWKEEEVLNQPLPFVPADRCAEAGALHQGELRGEGYVGLELVRQRKDGTRVEVELSSAPLWDGEGRIVGSMGLLRDISQQKAIEDQLRQSQKMEAVGQLAGGVAHDFNNMLGVILGQVDLALGQVDPAQPLYADLTAIRKAAERSADLTRQLLAFARKQTVAPKVMDLNQTVAGMLTMLVRLIGEDIDLRWQPGADLWPVKVDPSQIDQILANLCVNARDAIVDVGRVTIETGNSTFDAAYCAHHAGFVPGEHVWLTVSDDGCGMEKETLDHLFEPFFTTKDVGQGTGLGLATVYGIVKQNDGFVNVCSEPGRGTTFTMYLPRYVGKAEQARKEGLMGPTARGQETILLVEDERAILKMTARMLALQGYTVLAASTPGEAIRLAQEHPDEIHLLMTDVVMPEMNGRDLAQNLLSLCPTLKRLFMSGYTADVIAHHGVLDDGVYFIQKPFTVQGVAAKVREALDGECGEAS